MANKYLCSLSGISLRSNFTLAIFSAPPRALPPKKSSFLRPAHFNIRGSFSENLSKARQVTMDKSFVTTSSNCRFTIFARSAIPSWATAGIRYAAFFAFDSISTAERSCLTIRHGIDGRPAPVPTSAKRAFCGRNASSVKDSRICRTANSSAEHGATRWSTRLCS